MNQELSGEELMRTFKQMVANRSPKKEIAEFIMANAHVRYASCYDTLIDAILKSDYAWVVGDPEVVMFYTYEFVRRSTSICEYSREAIVRDLNVPTSIRVAVFLDPYIGRSFYYDMPCRFRSWFGVALQNPLTQRIKSQYEMPATLCEAVLQDSLPSFEIMRQMCGKKLSLSLIQHLLSAHASNIMTYLIMEYEEKLKSLFMPQDLLFYVCETWDEVPALQLLKTLQHKYPNLIQTARDEYGNNALWYAFYNPSKSQKIIEFLKTAGCDPDAYNEIHLNYSMLSQYATRQRF